MITDDTSALAPGWAAFTDNLDLLLSDMPPGSYLILGPEELRYIQFAVQPTEIYAEVSGNAIMEPRWHLTEAQHQALSEAGWSWPTDEDRNWHRSIARDADGHRLLAERAVEALRTALRVAAPTDLSADGWEDGPDAEDPALDMTVLGIGPGRMSDSNARTVVHWYLRDHGIGVAADAMRRDRLPTGWVFVHPSPDGREGDELELYVSDDYRVQRRPPRVETPTFQEACERQYRERNPQ